MSNIQKFTPIESHLEKMRSALIEKKVNECPHSEIVLSISAAIDKAIFYLGYNTEDYDRDMLKIMVIDDIKRSFFSLSLSEINIAIENGSRGQYGEVRGFAPKDAFNWIDTFRNDSVRLNLKKEIQEKNEFQQEPSDEEKEKLYWFNLKNAWEEYKREGYFNDVGNAVYYSLSITKKINFSEQERNQFKSVAKNKLLLSFSPEKHLGDNIKVKEAMKMIREINTGNENQRIIAEAKRIALNQFFKNLHDLGSEIEDLFQ